MERSIKSKDASITWVSTDNKDLHHYYFNSLLFRDVDALPQTLNLELLAGGAAVNVLDVVRRCLKVAGGIVALGDEDVVLGAVLKGLEDGDRRSLCQELSVSMGFTCH